MEILGTKISNFLIFVCVGFMLFLLFCALCLNHVSVNEMGVFYNAGNGTMWTQETPGWYITWPWPWVQEITADLRPMKVELSYTGARLVNAKLIRFRKEGWLDYVKLQGFSAPNGSVLLGYAYSGRQFSFLEILEEPDKEQSPDQKKVN